MKKLLVISLLALTAVVFAPSRSVTTAGDEEVHMHSIAEARSVTWQCRNCGDRIYANDRSPAPKASYGCGGEFDRRHVWERLD